MFYDSCMFAGNDDTKLGIPPQTRTAVQEQPPDDSLANPAEVEAEQPKNTLSLRAPSKSPSAYANMNSDIVSGPEDRSAAVEAVEDQSTFHNHILLFIYVFRFFFKI